MGYNQDLPIPATASKPEREQAETDEWDSLDFWTLLPMARIRCLEDQTPGKYGRYSWLPTQQASP